MHYLRSVYFMSVCSICTDRHTHTHLLRNLRYTQKKHISDGKGFMRGIRDAWQGSRAHRADLVLVRPANDLRGRSQLRSAHPAPRQPQLHRRLGNQVSRREGPSPLAVYHLCFACTRNSVLVIPGFDFLYSRKHRWGKCMSSTSPLQRVYTLSTLE